MNPSKPVDFDQWLQFHNIAVDAIAAFLSREAETNDFAEDDALFSEDAFGDIKSAIETVEQAFKQNFPALHQEISTAIEETQILLDGFPDNLEPPFFVGNREAGPIVGIDFDGSARALVDLAHEFGHALQFNVANKKQVPPVWRETFAFLAEIVLLDFLIAENDERAEMVWRVMREDDKEYLVEDFLTLKAASENPEVSYQYEWNYPVARYLADWIRNYKSITEREDLFLHSSEFAEQLNANEVLRISNVENSLPPFPNYNPESQDGAYAQLGAMALLETENWNDVSEISIGQFYVQCAEALKDGNALIQLDVAMRPAAYAVWQKENGTANILHQCEPFGENRVFRKSLETTTGKFADSNSGGDQ